MPLPKTAITLVLLSCLFATPALAQGDGWLDRYNRAMHDLNRQARGGLSSLTGRLPELPEMPQGIRAGAGNLITTWVANPWQAFALGVAGRPADARSALARSWLNITQGEGGLRDRASETGMPRPPAADLGLALCARGVPAGPYVVLPFVGGRNLRDGLADLVVANAVIYAALIPLIGAAPPLELLLALQLLDNIPIWLLAERMGRAEGDDAAGLDAIREFYRAARAAACERLRAPD